MTASSTEPIEETSCVPPVGRGAVPKLAIIVGTPACDSPTAGQRAGMVTAHRKGRHAAAQAHTIHRRPVVVPDAAVAKLTIAVQSPTRDPANAGQGARV